MRTKKKLDKKIDEMLLQGLERMSGDSQSNVMAEAIISLRNAARTEIDRLKAENEKLKWVFATVKDDIYDEAFDIPTRFKMVSDTIDAAGEATQC